jgi:hypothetical protein
VIIMQQRHDLFRLGALREGRKTAQIAEEDGDISAVALKDTLISG